LQVLSLPTFEDAQKIIDAGHIDKMMVDQSRFPFVFLRPARREDGSCVFLENERCSLHASGLKPTEGKYVDHNHHMPPWWYSMVYRRWARQDGKALVEKVLLFKGLTRDFDKVLKSSKD
jgi:hypothetical protein